MPSLEADTAPAEKSAKEARKISEKTVIAPMKIPCDRCDNDCIT
jgi:hypothetical protein